MRIPTSPYVAGGLIASALLAIGLVAGCGLPPLEKPTHAQAASDAAAARPRVTVGPVSKESPKRYTSQPARLVPFEETPLYSRLSAYVESVPVDIGDVVKKGAPLIVLATPELNDDLNRQLALVEQAAAEVEQAKAALVAANAHLATSQAKARQTESGVARAKADFKRWESQLARMKQLVENGSVTQKLAEETESHFLAAEASLAEAQATIESAQAAVQESEAHVAQAKADQTAAEAKLKVANSAAQQARTMLAYGTITAPYDGVIIQRHVDARHFVQPSGASGRPLLVIAHHTRLRAVADIPELESPLVDVGDAATLQVQALGMQEFPGQIARTSYALDPANRTLRVEVDYDSHKGQLRPGMYATLRVLLAERSDVLTVPAAALVWKDRQPFCCRVVGEKIARVPVQIGLRVGDRVEILAGLEPDSEIVLARAEALTDGQSVEVVRPEK